MKTHLPLFLAIVAGGLSTATLFAETNYPVVATGQTK